MFQRVQVTPNGLQAIERIPEFDFGCIVPTTATLSVINVMEEGGQFPLKCSPARASEILPWWSDLSWGSFCFVSYLARAMLTGNPRSVHMYLEVLPTYDVTMPMALVASASQKTREYQEVTKPLMQSCRVTSVEEFNAAFRQAYCLFRRHALPFWSGAGGGFGHPHFASSTLVQQNPECDLLGLVPIIDLAAHHQDPNMMVGFPDPEMLAWLGQEKGVRVNKGSGYFVLQATRDVEAGEMLTVNKNAFFNFDEATFEAWFGIPFKTQASETAAPFAKETATRGVLDGPPS
jgi:hypothetical protein